MKRIIMFSTLAASLGLVLGMPLTAQTGSGAMLANLEKGEWTVRFRSGSPDRKICVRTGRELIKLAHTAADCTRFVVEDEASVVTVQYTCKGHGYGLTSVRRETSSLVQLESEGIADDLPFEITAEARRTGICS